MCLNVYVCENFGTIILGGGGGGGGGKSVKPVKILNLKFSDKKGAK